MFSIVHTECVARGVCEANTSEQSIHNSYESRPLFIQSNKVKSIYSTVFSIRSTGSAKQLILFDVKTPAPPVDRSTVFHVFDMNILDGTWNLQGRSKNHCYRMGERTVSSPFLLRGTGCQPALNCVNNRLQNDTWQLSFPLCLRWLIFVFFVHFHFDVFNYASC